MTISRTTLKKIIAEELNKGSRQRASRRSLVSVLFEEAGDKEEEAEANLDAHEEIEDFMKTPLKKQPDNPAEKLSPDAREILKKPDEDGNDKDDKEIGGAAGSTPTAASSLSASQNEVGEKQSLNDVCMGQANKYDGPDYTDVNFYIASMKQGASITFKSPILAAQTADGLVILDGHHRWSKASMINPTAMLNVEIAQAPSLKADEVLRAVHLTILAKTGTDKTIPAVGNNLFDTKPGVVEKLFDSSQTKVNPETLERDPNGVAPYVAAVMKTSNPPITDPAEGKKKAVERVMENITKLSKVGDAPPRGKMPQPDPYNPDANPISGGDVIKALAAGEVNWNSPTKPGTSTSTATKSREDSSRKYGGDPILERWSRLAGLIK